MEEKTVPLYSLLIFLLAPKIHSQLLKCWPVLHAKPSNKIYVDCCLALMPLPHMEKHGILPVHQNQGILRSLSIQLAMKMLHLTKWGAALTRGRHLLKFWIIGVPNQARALN